MNAPGLEATLLPSPPGAHPDAEAIVRAHDAVMAALAIPAPYRFAWVEGPVGSRDAVVQVSDAAYRTLRERPESAEVTLVVVFATPVGDPAWFDALVWGQRQGMAEIDRLRYPRVPGPDDTVSVAGRLARVRAVPAQRDGVPVDTLVLHFEPFTAGS